MFIPKYTITNKILKDIGIVEASREVIMHAPLIPAWEAKFRKEAIERTIHHGTHLEGNPLSSEEVRDVLEGTEVIARDRDVQEVINYRNVAINPVFGERSFIINSLSNRERGVLINFNFAVKRINFFNFILLKYIIRTPYSDLYL